MNILLLGSGGRESALAWKMAQSPLCQSLYIAPGNGGTSRWGTNVPDLKPMDMGSVGQFVQDHAIDMVVVGNEDPLVAGIADFLHDRNPRLLVVGPERAGARLEGSKDFAKDFMGRHGIPTASHKTFDGEHLKEGLAHLRTLRAPYVLKADGLAAGKGVLILHTLKEAEKALEEMLDGKFGNASSQVVIEEFLDGIECSVFVLTDGKGRYRLLPVAKDYKRVGEGDTGPNTGGMGAVSPVPFADHVFMEKVRQRIIEPTLRGLMKDGIDYRGFIFFGLINVGGAPMVIEYNVRMGDPETEVVMPRIASDLVPVLKAVAEGQLPEQLDLCEDPRVATTVMMVSQGYPGSYQKGAKISVADPNSPQCAYFHAGTKADPEGGFVTSGGRVMAATCLGEDINQALRASYRAVRAVDFDGKTFRKDIGVDLGAMPGCASGE